MLRFTLFTIALTAAVNADYTEVQTLNAVTQCLFSEVKDQPFSLTKALNHPQTHLELCFTDCLFKHFQSYDADGNVKAEIVHDTSKHLYGQADKVGMIAHSCAKEVRIDTSTPECERIKPLAECFVKYADIYGLDRTKHLV